MKKLHFLIVGIILLSAFCACQKDQLGVYDPKFKIQKVYAEGDNRYMLEQWTWNGATLDKIDFYRPSGTLNYTHQYQYDEKNRLTRIESGDQYTEFLYDGKQLTTINTYQRDKLQETYHLTFDKDKLVHISIEKPTKGTGNAGLLPFFIPGTPDVAELVFSAKDSKLESYDYSSAEIEFQWQDDNVQYMRMELVRPDSIQHLTFSYVYDESLNPKNGFLTLLTDHALLNDRPQYHFCSKNNALNILVTDKYDIFSETKSFTYGYDCYKKYPTKIYSTFFNRETNKEDSTLIYTYVYAFQ